MKNNLKLIVLEGMKDVGSKINDHLKTMNDMDVNFIVPAATTRFSNGEGKAKLEDTIRDKDVYILNDIGNYSITYKMYDFYNHKSPDDHYQDIKRVIYAIKDHSKTNSVFMPLLYESRQHRRSGRESLDCACALQELVGLGVKNILTFDVHDIDIQNAIPRSSFDSFYPTREVVSKLLEENIDFRNMFVIAPDTGAISRNNMYANLFKCDMGFFRKERDTSKVIDGKSPITKHKYVGGDFTSKNVIIVDDMIASGQSILEVAASAKENGAKNIYLVATFALFTEGIDKINKAYQEGIFTKIYTTNLTYFNELYKEYEWLVTVDCSYKIADIINRLNKGESISPLLNESDIITEQINKKLIRHKSLIK